MLNKATLIGRLGKDPEVKSTQGGQTLVNFTLATSEKYKDQSGERVERTEWHNIVAFGKLADIIGQYLTKGSMVYIEGKIQTREYEKDGQRKYMTSIVASEMKMLGGRGEQSMGHHPIEKGHTYIQDDEIPF